MASLVVQNQSFPRINGRAPIFGFHALTVAPQERIYALTVAHFLIPVVPKDPYKTGPVVGSEYRVKMWRSK